MYAHVSKLTKRYGDRMFAADDASKRFVKNAVYAGTIITHYRTQHANFQQPTPWPFPCTAGETTAVIDYNGDVRACELREKFASLADFDYDFGALWAAQRTTGGARRDRRRQSVLVYARLLYSRLDAPFASRLALRSSEKLPDARELVTDGQAIDQEENRKSGFAYAAGIALFASVVTFCARGLVPRQVVRHAAMVPDRRHRPRLRRRPVRIRPSQLQDLLTLTALICVNLRLTRQFTKIPVKITGFAMLESPESFRTMVVATRFSGDDLGCSLRLGA